MNQRAGSWRSLIPNHQLVDLVLVLGFLEPRTASQPGCPASLNAQWVLEKTTQHLRLLAAKTQLAQPWLFRTICSRLLATTNLHEPFMYLLLFLPTTRGQHLLPTEDLGPVWRRSFICTRDCDILGLELGFVPPKAVFHLHKVCHDQCKDPHYTLSC